MIVITIINLGVGASMTTVIYALQQRGFTPTDIGWLSAGIGVAMLLGAVASSAIVTRIATGILEILGIGALALSVAVVPFVEDLWAIVALLAAGSVLIPAESGWAEHAARFAEPRDPRGQAESVDEAMI